MQIFRQWLYLEGGLGKVAVQEKNGGLDAKASNHFASQVWEENRQKVYSSISLNKN